MLAKRLLLVVLAAFLFVAAIVPTCIADDSDLHLEVTEDAVEGDIGEDGQYAEYGSDARDLDQIEEEELVDDGFPDAHPDVTTGFVVPEFQDLIIPLGSTVELLCGFRNGASTPLNVTAIVGSLNFAGDFRYYVQNFSMVEFGNVVVPAGQEVSLSYFVRPDPLLEPRDFILAATVLYEDPDGRGVYASTFFNATIELVDPVGMIDTVYLSVGLATVAVASLIAFVVYKATASLRKGKGSRTVETGTRSGPATGASDFIADIVSPKRRTPSRARSTSSK